MALWEQPGEGLVVSCLAAACRLQRGFFMPILHIRNRPKTRVVEKNFVNTIWLWLRQAGRPPRDPKGGAAKLYPVRLTVSERAEYELAAARAGMTVSSWIRDRLGKAAKRKSR